MSRSGRAIDLLRQWREHPKGCTEEHGWADGYDGPCTDDPWDIIELLDVIDPFFRRTLAAKVEAVVLKWSCPPLENRGNTLVLRDLRNLLADAQTPATSHAAGTGAANGASVDAETRDGGAGL